MLFSGAREVKKTVLVLGAPYPGKGKHINSYMIWKSYGRMMDPGVVCECMVETGERESAKISFERSALVRC